MYMKIVHQYFVYGVQQVQQVATQLDNTVDQTFS